MTSPVIQVENLSKRYRIGATSARQDTLGEKIMQAVSAPLRNLSRLRRLSKFGDGDLPTPHQSEDIIWALWDLSFEVRKGEVLGVIGRNGAGKSTLLKILTRITEPTRGEARIYGRISSLLEVGTGFHPELTGRENVYLNGAILGMHREEIGRKFDEIVDFAEIEKFIDTPVKRYSSGMYVRLAFAVAAHLEPEILLVDEVLAVGDVAFQKKCLGKMNQVSGEGRTILFVSHNIGAIRNLCSRTIWLEEGRIQLIGNTEEVTDSYLRQSRCSESLEDIEAKIRALPSDPAFRLEGIEIRQNAKPGTKVTNGKAVEVKIQYRVLQPTRGLRVYFDLLDEDENILFRTFHDQESDAIPRVDTGRYVSIAKIPEDLLAPRSYDLVVRATIHNIRSCTADGIRIPLVVEQSNQFNRAYGLEPCRPRLQPRIPWETVRLVNGRSRFTDYKESAYHS